MPYEEPELSLTTVDDPNNVYSSIFNDEANFTRFLPPFYVWSLLFDTLTVGSIRFFSVGSVLATQQLMARENKELGSIMSYYNNMQNINAVFRDSTRFYSNFTKLALADIKANETIEANETREQRQEKDRIIKEKKARLKHLFISTYLTVPVVTCMSLPLIQAYALLLPVTQAPHMAVTELRWPALKFAANYLLINTSVIKSFYNYGRGKLIPTMLTFAFGGVVIIVTSNLLPAELGFMRFIMANMAQNVAIISTDLVFTHIYYKEEKLLHAFLEWNNFPTSWKAFKDAEFFKTLKDVLKQGKKYGAQTAFDTIISILVTLSLRDSTNLVAYQSVQIIPSSFSAMAIPNESTIANLAIGCWKNPAPAAHVERELIRLLFHATWVMCVPPSLFLMISFYIKDYLIEFLMKHKAENNDVIEIIRQELLLIFLLTIVRNARSAAYAIVTSFVGTKDAYHERQNTRASLLNSAGSAIMLCLGFLLDITLGMGAYGFVMAAFIAFTLTWLGQVVLALQSIHYQVHEAGQIPIVIEPGNSKKMIDSAKNCIKQFSWSTCLKSKPATEMTNLLQEPPVKNQEGVAHSVVP